MHFNKRPWILTALALTACSATPPTVPSDDPAIGSYVLQSVANQRVPVRRSSTTVITDGTLFLSGDGTYSSAVHQEVTENGSTTVSVIGLPSGSWARLSDRTLRLTPIVGSELALTGFIELPGLYFTLDGVLYVYVKK